MTEQIEHTMLCIEVDKRKAREAEERAEPDPPDGVTSIPYTSGWWPNGWLNEDLNGNLFASGGDGLDNILCALSQLVKLALTHPGLSEIERTFYRRNASRAREGYVMGTRQHAAAWLREADARHESRLSGKSHPPPDEALLAACSAIPLDRLRRIATLGGHEGAVARAELSRRGES